MQAQVNLDSLWGIWNDETAHDSIRIQALYSIAYDGYLFLQPDSAFYFAQLQYDFAKSKGLKKEMANAMNTQGISYYIRSDYDNALEYYQGSLKLREEVSDNRGVSVSLTNIGMIYSIRGDYPTALEYYMRSLKIVEDISDKVIMASILNSIGKIYKYQGNYPRALNYYQQSYEISKENSDKKGMANILNNLGSIYMNQGLYPKAIDHYQRSFKIREEISDKRGMAGVLNNIGLIYFYRNEYVKALDYFQRGLIIKEEISDKNGMAITFNNMGLIFKNQENYSKALDYYQRSLDIREEISDKRGMAGTLNNIGEVYLNQGDNQRALEYYQHSLDINKEISNKRGTAITLNNIGKISFNQGDHLQAVKWCENALNISEEINAIDIQKDACDCLYQVFKAMGNTREALAYHERIILLNDSLEVKETAKKLQQMEFARQMLADSLAREKEKLNIQMAHEAEVRKKNRIRNIYFVTGLFLFVFAIGFYRRIIYIRKAKQQVEGEKERSDKLLLNILPPEIADELKEKGRAKARNFESVSVLFTDFKGFIQISEKLSAEELVEEINTCFKEFDAICKKYDVEKIKTIGDAYMAAGGLPVPGNDSVKHTVLAGLEMKDFMIRKKQKCDTEGNLCFEMRLGIHTGPVVAGIVGVTKFQYDIWGDAVNTASRIENSGEVGKVNISQSTYELIKDDPLFKFQSRGKVKVKGKSAIEMWFVEKVTISKNAKSCESISGS